MQLPEIKIAVTFRGKKSELKSLTSAEDTAAVIRQLMSKDGLIHYREEMIVLCLNQGNKVIGYHRVSAGGQTATVADLRMIATLALNCTANQIILAHNHPSGSLQPSSADIALTRRAKEGLALLDIRLLDHLIVTDERYYSFAEEGEL
jgi:DNA repair protein RadC